MNKNNEKLAITLGDPSGIGPEVIIKAISNLYSDKKIANNNWRYKDCRKNC